MRSKSLTFYHWSKLDTWIILGSIVYVTLPILLFFCGWLKLPLAILFSFVFLLFITHLSKSIKPDENSLICKENCSYWITTLLIVILWAYMSGVGGFAFQNSDYWVRNPIFRDLSTYKWPVIYDLSKDTSVVQQITGSDTVAFSYYFAWWLPVAAISKLFALGETARNLLLLIWAMVGLFFIVYCVNRIIGKCSYIILAVLIFFSGLDVVFFYLENMQLPSQNHLEWWAIFFQYSSNTTQLFWVFNQSIPLWLLTCLFMLLKNNKYSAGLCSLAFAYSPWGTFGMVPYAIASVFKKDNKFINAINPLNILVPAIMLVVYGTFYMSSSGSAGGYGLIFSLYQNSQKRLLFTYLIFILIEFGVYYLAAGNIIKKYEYYYITLIQLILFPLFYIRDFNFSMRGSTPALFVTMLYIIRFLVENSNEISYKTRKRIVIVLLIIGSFTPIHEISRTVVQTITTDDFINNQVYSFGDMRTDNTNLISTVKDQFFVYDYENSIFFKYLAPKSD